MEVLKKKFIRGEMLTVDEERTAEAATTEDYAICLAHLCGSELLSLERLVPLLERMETEMPEDYWSRTRWSRREPSPVFNACANSLVSLEIFGYVLRYFRNAAEVTSSQFYKRPSPLLTAGNFGAYLLHVACLNDNCSDSAVNLLMLLNPSALLCFCTLDLGVDSEQDSVVNLLMLLNPSALQHFCWLDLGVDSEHLWLEVSPFHCLLMRNTHLNLSMVKTFVKQNGNVLSLQNEDSAERILPLSCLLEHGSVDNHKDVLRYLIHCVKQQGVNTIGGFQESPLHHICANPRATASAVQVVLQEWPDFVRARDSLGGRFAAHILYENEGIEDKELIDIVELLSEVDSDCLMQVNDIDKVPFFNAVRNQSTNVCRHFLSCDPGSIKRKNNEGYLPIHEACHCSQLETVILLTNLWPESIHIATDGGTLPIHDAARGDKIENDEINNAGVVRFLLEKDASLATLPDNDKMLPLHVACHYLNEDSFERIQALFDAFPEAINARAGGDNKLPIDFVDGTSYPETNIFLENQMTYYRLSQNNEAVSTPDELGNLALHRAIENGAAVGAIKLLVKGFSGALRILNGEGDSALHLACKSGHYTAVSYLVEQYPPAMEQCNGNGLLPLDIMSMQCPHVSEQDDLVHIDCMFRILRACPDVLLGLTSNV